MTEATKACNLTELEIKAVIASHCMQMLNGNQVDSLDERIERINYLNKRLKAFKEPEKTEGVTEQKLDAAIPAAIGWGT